ncbi:uncharacterized protein LOC106132636 [Amyelois transitella]|uniref:uncharacterized protein LOC106132636 n=1 Tax=Amyelois transitella TaxID=680683 RepID=UPI00298F5B3B|nr:uncharacterized protein LOC106132636 [Amyelois transitella]
MNTLIVFGLLVTMAVAYGATLPSALQPQIQAQIADAPDQVVEELEPQESRGYGHHGGGGWGHGGGGWGHHGGGWGHGGRGGYGHHG